jgi:hypothetical protein
MNITNQEAFLSKASFLLKACFPHFPALIFLSE